jgi:hypothetical protein
MCALGLATIGLGFLLAMLPRASPGSAAETIGGLLLIAAVIEFVVTAIAARWTTASLIGSAVVTSLAAVLLLSGMAHTFFVLCAIMTLWLIGRAITLLIAASRAPLRFGRLWLLITGLANVVLAILALTVTMSVATFYALFGPSTTGAGYSIIPALSLFCNGIAFVIAAMVLPTE